MRKRAAPLTTPGVVVLVLVSMTRMVAIASALPAVPDPEQGGCDLRKTPEPLFG
jgi:hypothetical protein